MSNQLELIFGTISTGLYLAWGAAAWNSPEQNRAFMLWFYAAANIAILWPALRRWFS